jgi:hypothetical protein
MIGKQRSRRKRAAVADDEVALEGYQEAKAVKAEQHKDGRLQCKGRRHLPGDSGPHIHDSAAAGHSVLLDRQRDSD